MFMHESSGPQPQAQSQQGNPNVAAFLQALASRAAQQAVAPPYQRPYQNAVTDTRLRPENRQYGSGTSWMHDGNLFDSHTTMTPYHSEFGGQPLFMELRHNVSENGTRNPYLDFYDNNFKYDPNSSDFLYNMVRGFSKPFNSIDGYTTR